jgi:hypothetical protein
MQTLLKTAIVATFAALSAEASTFSAQDILTYCQATHADPTFVRDKLRNLGWADSDPGQITETTSLVALGMVATTGSSSGASFNPTDWTESWAWGEEAASAILGKLDEQSSVVLTHPETGSLIWIDWADKSSINISCLLIVTKAATASQTYHPKLPAPNVGDAFLSSIEGGLSPTTRIRTSMVVASINPTVVQVETGFASDAVAAFYSLNKFPASAVRP